MAEQPLVYAVVLREPERFQPMEIARVLARVRKTPVHDIVSQVRASWGILADGAAQADASALAAALSEAGYQSLAVPSALIEELPPLRAVERLSYSAAGIIPEFAPPEPIKPFERLEFIAAAAFKQREVRKVKTEEGPGMGQKVMNLGITMATGIPVGLFSKKQEVERTVESSELLFVLDLILKDPAERLRIDAQNFDFSCLKAKKAYDVLGNFRRLLAELAALAPRAAQNRGAKTLLEGKPLREMGYESLADLERECRWLLTLRSLKA